MVTAELADGLFADLGLPEDVDDLRLAEPALTHRIRCFAWADSTISGGPVFGGQVTKLMDYDNKYRMVLYIDRDVDCARVRLFCEEIEGILQAEEGDIVEERDR